ncbi:MAG: hypothetical protein DMF87_11555 [Acidobacteria bacterium]|nr:MAG: hypothetical protein DMF87_11555 [Acidobacteriota bacterium]
MKILFSVGSFGFLRNFEPALRLLAEHGHDLHLVADRKDSVGGARTLDLLLRDYPERIRYSYAPSRKDSRWQPLATQLRLTLDYWRYLDARYDHSPSLRARGASQAPTLAARVTRSAVAKSRPVLGAMRAAVRGLERATPHGHRIEAFLRARVLVWNEAQRVEARELHGIPPERVTVTGAQAYDHWFVQKPTLSREAFCAKVGVPSDRPLLLYLCSSPFITPHEVPFVRRWIEAIRGASDPVLRHAAILIRPHPQNAEQWNDFDPSSYEAVGVWPRGGANPVDSEARADYFDSMFYSVAVVGVNTSALIESGIVGRPVYTVIADEFAGQQEGTLHFQHLKNVNGGLLTTAASIDEHLAQIAQAVRRVPARDEKARAFVESFVRPYGFDVPAAGRFVDALERFAAEPAPAPRRGTLAAALLRRAMLPLALLSAAAARRKRGDKRTPRGATPLQIMFALASPEYLRYYDSTMRLLAERGHHVSVAVNWLRERKAARLDGLSGDEGIEVIGVIPKRTDRWTPMARAVRGTFDFVRYLHPRLAEAPALRARMKRKVLPGWLHGLDRIRSLGDAGLNRFYAVLRGCERAIPVSRRLVDFLRAHAPDVIIVSPLVDAASDQVDLVRAAQAMRIPAVAGIASWDNLTNKGHMRVQPDAVTVWNEYQKAEAVTYHGVDAARVMVTGAQLFDRWFDHQPSQSREAFCRMVHLPSDRPIVLYTGSSVFIARSEVEAPFVRRWIAALRESADPMLRDAAILVRPHPFNCEAWEAADFSDLGPVSVWPRQRYTPSAEEARNSLFDSLFYSAAVVGVNTSAMIEAAILGRPVLSMLAPEFAATQEGTVHFHYLLPENGGFLRVAHTIAEHVPQLGEVLRTPEVTRVQTASFVGRFIRPHGLDAPCTPILADAIEQAARLEPRPVVETAGTGLMRIAAWPLAVTLSWASIAEKGGLGRRIWDRVERTIRIAVKRVVVRPALLAVRAVRVVGGKLRRGSRRGTRWMASLPARALRRARHARYHVGVFLRRDAEAGADSHDAHG